MSDFETLFATVTAAFFGIVVGLVIVDMIRAHLGARRWHRHAMIIEGRGQCLCERPWSPPR